MGMDFHNFMRVEVVRARVKGRAGMSGEQEDRAGRERKGTRGERKVVMRNNGGTAAEYKWLPNNK